MTAPIGLCIAGHVVCAALAGSATEPSAPGQTKRPKQDYNSGEYLYRSFCASCHGESGGGDGPAAVTLKAPLADLTMIARRAGGVFPREEVTRIIAGSPFLPGHATEMPRWEKVLRSVEGDNDRAIRQRIDSLVKHLESIQRP